MPGPPSACTTKRRQSAEGDGEVLDVRTRKKGEVWHPRLRVKLATVDPLVPDREKVVRLWDRRHCTRQYRESMARNSTRQAAGRRSRMAEAQDCQREAVQRCSRPADEERVRPRHGPRRAPESRDRIFQHCGRIRGSMGSTQEEGR